MRPLPWPAKCLLPDFLSVAKKHRLLKSSLFSLLSARNCCRLLLPPWLLKFLLNPYYLQYFTFISVIPFASSENFLFFVIVWDEKEMKHEMPLSFAGFYRSWIFPFKLPRLKFQLLSHTSDIMTPTSLRRVHMTFRYDFLMINSVWDTFIQMAVKREELNHLHPAPPDPKSSFRFRKLQLWTNDVNFTINCCVIYVHELYATSGWKYKPYTT